MRPAALAVLSLVAIACAPVGSGSDASPVTTAGPSGPALATASPSPSVQPPTEVVSLGAQVELSVGDSVSVEGKDITVSLLEARGPEAGCSDCPNSVRLLVMCPSGPQELEYAFSGGMEEAALERARRNAACGMQFYIVEVHEGNAVIRVDAPT